MNTDKKKSTDNKKRGGVSDSDEEEEAKKVKNMKTEQQTPTDDDEADDLALKIFMNPIILPIIVKHLPTRCLPRLRSTNKLWNATIVPEYRQRNANDKLCFVHVGSRTKQTAFDKLNDSTVVPWGAYEFENISFSSREIQNLIVKVGGIMTRLKLTLSSKDAHLSIDEFRTLVLVQTPVLAELSIADSRSCARSFWKSQLVSPTDNELTLPNLKRIILDLKLGIDPTNHVENYYTTFPLITELLCGANNLEAVKINGVDINGLILRVLKQKQGLDKLKSIKLASKVSIANLEGLIALTTRKSNALQLKKLNLRRFLGDDSFIDPDGQRLLKQFLALQGSFLQKLTASLTDWSAHNPDESPHYQIHLPLMSSLKSLKLELEYFIPTPIPNNNAGAVAAVDNENNANNDNGPPPVPVPNITFDSLKTNFPNLTKLVLMDMSWIQDSTNACQQWTQFLNQLGPPHTGIIDLSLCIYDGLGYLGDLASRFPNVKTLKIKFSTKLSSDVWSLWPAVETMDIELMFAPEEEEFEIDSWITGISSEGCKMLTTTLDEAKTKAEGELKMGGLNWKEYKISPGISDLHELREFNLNFGWLDGEVVVTDLSGHYGFLGCPTEESQLRRIYVSSGSNFSEECVADVEAALGPHGDFVPFDEMCRQRFEELRRKRRGNTI